MAWNVVIPAPRVNISFIVESNALAGEPLSRQALRAASPRASLLTGNVLKFPRGEQIPLAAKRDPYTPEQPTTRSLFRYPQSGDTPQHPGKVAGSLNVREPVIPPSLGRYTRPKENLYKRRSLRVAFIKFSFNVPFALRLTLRSVARCSCQDPARYGAHVPFRLATFAKRRRWTFSAYRKNLRG